MSEPNAFYGTDKRHDEDCTDWDNRQEWIEQSASRLVKKWYTQLDADDYIEDLGGFDHDDIMTIALHEQKPFAVVLYQLAHKHVSESNLYEELSWGEQ